MERRVDLQSRSSRRAQQIVASAIAPPTTVRIGTRGSPLALAQAYMTRDLLKVFFSLVPMQK